MTPTPTPVLVLGPPASIVPWFSSCTYTPSHAPVPAHLSRPYAFGWAVHGFTGGGKAAMPTVFSLDPWQSEPDTRSNEAAISR